MKVKFLESMPGTKISMVIGRTYATAKGEIIENFTGQLLKVVFPNSIFLSIEHPKGSNIKTGRFSFEFWYLDQDADEKDAELIDGDYSLLTEVTGKYNKSISLGMNHLDD